MNKTRAIFGVVILVIVIAAGAFFITNSNNSTGGPGGSNTPTNLPLSYARVDGEYETIDFAEEFTVDDILFAVAPPQSFDCITNASGKETCAEEGEVLLTFIVTSQKLNDESYLTSAYIGEIFGKNDKRYFSMDYPEYPNLLGLVEGYDIFGSDSYSLVAPNTEIREILVFSVPKDETSLRLIVTKENARGIVNSISHILEFEL